MSSIQRSAPNYPVHQNILQPAKPAGPQETGAPAKQPPQTASYVKTGSREMLPLPKGAYRNGDMWVMPPDYLKPVGRPANTVLANMDISVSAKANSSGEGGAAGLDAEFKGSLLVEAVAYTDLERNIHKLLGFSVESYKTTLTASNEISAKAALADGSFFKTALSQFAASYSIFTKYTYDENFRSQYDQNPPSAVEYNFSSLKNMMESLVIKNPAG